MIDEKLLAANPENPQAQVDLTFSLNQLSWGYSNLGDLAAALAAMQESLAMREKILARNPGEARAQDQLAYALRAMALLRRQTGDRAAARRDYLRAHAIYTDLRARGYGGAYVGSELGVTELELGELAEEEGRQAEACQWYRRSAAVYGELAARGAVLPNHHEDAENGPPRRRGLRPLTPGVSRLRVPPIPSVLLAAVSVMIGATIAKQIFPALGPAGTTAVRIGLSALMLAAAFRPPIGRLTAAQWRAVVPYGLGSAP